jgi:predicted anti-sigma-YlaC factor YlaD
MITIDSLPAALGGSPEKAKEHFEKAVKIQEGKSPGPYVALATGVMVPAQDRAGFEKLLNEALAIDPLKDPSTQLVTLIAQRRARALLDNIETKFAKH